MGVSVGLETHGPDLETTLSGSQFFQILKLFAGVNDTIKSTSTPEWCMGNLFTHRQHVLLVVLITIVSMATVPLAAADSHVSSSERTIVNQNPAPGDTVTVTVETELNSAGDRLGLTDEITPAAGGSLSLEAVTVNGDPVQPSFPLTDDGFIDITVEESFSAGDVVTLTYTVPIPDNASEGDTFDLAGNVTLDDSAATSHTGDATITVEEQTDPIESSNRVIAASDAAPGESVSVSLNAAVGQAGDSATITDSFDPAFANAALDQVLVNDSAVTPSAASVSDENLSVTVDNVSADSVVTVVYTVTLPDTADAGQVYAFDGASTLDSAASVTHDGDQSLSVSGTGAIASVERTVQSEVSPGEQVSVSLTAQFGEAGDRASLEEEFTPAVAASNIESVQYNGANTFPVTNINDPEFVSLTLDENFEGGDTVTLTYTLDIPENATVGTTYTLNGTVGYDAVEEPIPADTLTVANNSGTISIANQSGGGETVVVETAAASANYSVGIVNASGALVGQSDAIAADTTVDNYTVTLDTPLTESQTVMAVVYEGTSTTPFTVDGSPVEASATYDVNVALRYTDDEGVVTSDGLRDAVADWRGGTVSNSELRMILEAWRTGQPVA